MDTPFLDESFDGIDLYVYPDSVNRVRVTDNGETLNRLESQGIFINGRTRQRNKMLADVLSSFGIEREDNSKKLFIVTTRQNFPDAKQRLLQGVLKINDLIYTNSRSVQGLLQDQVADALKQNHILFSKNRALVVPNGQSFIFDFLIPTQSHGDTVVRAFHSPQRSDSAKVYSWDAARINRDIQMRPGKYVSIVDDNNASTKWVDQFCDILNSNNDPYCQSKCNSF
ncbi:DUF1828 domain-containing protein [Latilactobacillus sakei]|nr:DUF1828 domain-containing protein [Latilactobacillus sakei]UNC23978.1 DUF1828 domain-containing protein [Latilactobacillus sakei]